MSLDDPLAELVARYEAWDQKPGDPHRAARLIDTARPHATAAGVSTVVVLDRVQTARRAGRGLAAAIAAALLTAACTVTTSNRECVRGHDEVHDGTARFVCDEYRFPDADR